MQKFIFGVAVLGVSLVAGDVAAQDPTATGVVNYEVEAIREIRFTGLVEALVIAGSGDLAGVTGITTWGLTTNVGSQKVTGQVDQELETGLTLSLELEAPGTATASEADLGVAATDLVTGIGQVDAAGLTATFRLRADPTAGAVAATSRTVTLTLTDDV